MNLQKDYPIGVFDSGVGGLTVLKQLKDLLPNESFVYLGDTKNNPYGPRDEEDIFNLSVEIVKYLQKKPVKMAVIACNTITVVAGDKLKEQSNIPIVGNSYGVESALKATNNKCVGVMATEATIKTHKHKNAILEASTSITVVEEACPTLASDIEEGIVYHPELKDTLIKHLGNLIRAGVDTIILGCTHYPFVEDILLEIVKEKFPNSKITFIDPGMETALNAKELLLETDLLASSKKSQEIEVLFTKVLDTTKIMVEEALSDRENNVQEILI